MMNDSSILFAAKLKDGDGQYVWQEGLTLGAPDIIRGHEVVPNNDMDELGTGNKPVVFGSPRAYKIREAGMMRFQRLVERYAEYSQVGFLAVQRADGKYVNAGTNPVKAMVNA